MRLLPIGIQDFADIRERGFVYVDKSVRIHQLLTGSGKPFFLSRPRRFGKSLLCSTLGAIFEGRRELFGEIAGRPALAIDSLEWEWKKYPVVRLDLNAEVYSNGVEALHRALNYELQREADKNGITLKHTDAISRFKYLIEKAYVKVGEKAVIIIDEYDKPLINTLDKPSIHEQIRDELKGFYGVLKSSDEYLRLVFITGVTKFSRVSVFSDLNHLDDITLSPRYADICGLTQKELEQNFEPEIDAILEETGRNREEYMENLRRYYNGYRFSEKPLTVYNPFGLLNHFNNNGKFSPYWYETASPSFLIDLVVRQKINIANLGDLSVRDEDFRKYDSENMNAVPLLYQTGYLTISGYDEERDRYTLDYPNLEVRSSFATSLLKQYVNVSEDRSNALIFKLPDALTDGITKQSQENQPLITVITVVRNDEKSLEETILSVINQTYKNVEYIIVDGASTDGTLDVIKKYEDRIDYWMSEPDKGIYNAMNKGIDLATGEWINFMNSGDRFYLPTTLQDIFGKENSALEADIIYGDTILVYDIGSYVKKAKPLENMLEHFPFGHQSSFVKSKLMKEIRFDETYKSSGDYNFFYNCYLNKRSFAHFDVIVAVYNAEYGMSLNYKLVRQEDARIHGIEKTLRWKIKFSINYTIYLIKSCLKRILPRNLVTKIMKRNIKGEFLLKEGLMK